MSRSRLFHHRTFNSANMYYRILTSAFSLQIQSTLRLRIDI